MNIKILLTAILLSCSTIIVAGCAHDGHERTAGTVVDDSAITTSVKSQLLAEKDVNSFDIKVKTFKGNVQLSGFVDSKWQMDKAVSIAAATEGVRHVQNDLIHKPKSQ
jgi:hyperosmotically inducible protein